MNHKEIKKWWEVQDAITHNKNVTVEWLFKCIEKLEDVLKYYADINSYSMTAGGSVFMRTDQPWIRAQKALEELNE